jgi:hypothetical protein
MLADRRQEGDHVVARVLLYLQHPVHIEGGPLPDGGSGLPGDHPELRHRLGGGDLHPKPALELVLLAPDPAHLRQCVARYQLALLSSTDQTSAAVVGLDW